MTVSLETVRMAKSQLRQNQSAKLELTDISSCHKIIINFWGFRLCAETLKTIRMTEFLGLCCKWESSPLEIFCIPLFQFLGFLSKIAGRLQIKAVEDN